MSHMSLMHGWIPAVVQLVTALVLLMAAEWRTRRWCLVVLPTSVVLGAATAAGAHWYLHCAGLASDPAPITLWIWIAVAGWALGAASAGWYSARWGPRALSVAAVPLAVLCVALSVNAWVGYLPTVDTAWNQFTAGPLPDQTDRAALTAMRSGGATRAKGAVVEVHISAAASKFTHRGELVYLPPAWFATNPAPRLPAVMMIGGEFNTPADWIRAGGAVTALDDFAAVHGGHAPVVVFVDSGGGFNIDTECVNGVRGNAADHLTKDVVPFVVSSFGVSAEPSSWGVAGFSAGGTCAIDLAAMHPELFGTFLDIAGDLSPNTGTKAQTIDRLFGGSAAAWSEFDPTTVITRHGPYRGVTGLFIVSGAVVDKSGNTTATPNPEDAAANALCGLGTAHGMACTVVAEPGKHDWPFAGIAFTAALPWLAGQLNTPAVARIPPPPTTSPSRAPLASASPTDPHR